ncbi:MAG: PD-(D/E)XK nuclease family protein [Puniceicoccaceae bacterium]
MPCPNSSTFLRRFIAPRFPLADAIAEHLLPNPQGKTVGPLDYSDTLLILPTRNACRSLRAALVQRAHSFNTGLVSLNLVSPGVFLDWFLPAQVASPLQLEDAWDRVLQAASIEELQPILPALADRLSSSNRMALLRKIEQLRQTLFQAGHTFQTVPDVLRCHQRSEEKQRWVALAALEHRVVSRLGASQLLYPAPVVDFNHGLPSQLTHTKQLILAVEPEPSPLLLKTLSSLQTAGLKVELIIPQPAGVAPDSFDSFGRPIEGSFSSRPIDLPPDSLIVAEDSSAFCQTLAAHLNGSVETSNGAQPLALGFADPSETALVGPQLERAALPIFDPSGQTLASTAAFGFFSLLSDWLHSRSLEAFQSWLHLPLVPEFFNLKVHPVALLRQWFDFRSRSLPSTLEVQVSPEMQEPLASVLSQAAALFKQADRDPKFLANLRTRFLSTLQSSTAAPKLLFPHPDACDLFLDTLEEIVALPEEAMANHSRLNLFLNRCRKLAFYPEKKTESIELLGWQEWIWDAHPTLFAVGIREGVLPETFRGQPFLNQTERESLGLPTAITRLERDAYLLHLLCTLRPRPHQLYLIHTASGPDSYPATPSRLLFLTSPDAIPRRIQTLYAPPLLKSSRPPQTPPAILPLPSAPQPTHLSVSDFSLYLNCPYGFYLRRMLRMDLPDPLDEISPRAFGNLCHRCFQRLNLEETNLEDEQAIQAALVHFLDQEAATAFNGGISLVPTLQLNNLRKRLSAAAPIIGERRQAGWRCEKAEWKFGAEDSFKIGQFPVRGIIDCVEINKKTGAVAIIDYKTGGGGKTPDKTHFGTYPSNLPEDVFHPDEGIELSGKRKRWIDLQLPLYALAVKQILGYPSSVAYFNLPLELSATGIHALEVDHPNLLESARRCAEAVVQGIRENRFFPPRRKPREYFNLERLWVDDPATEMPYQRTQP